MSTVKAGLSKKLLTRVLSVYFVLTLVVTGGQILTEYLSTKSHIQGELKTMQSTFRTSLTRAIWELNIPQAQNIAEGLLALPIIEGVQIRDENGQYLFDQGATAALDNEMFQVGVSRDLSGGLFAYSFPLIHEFSGSTTYVGDVTLYSSFGIILGRIEIGLFFLVGNAIIKTGFLIFLFMSAFRRMLSEPLTDLTTQIQHFDPDNPASSRLDVVLEDDNELRLLQDAYNKLIDQLATSNEDLKRTQLQLTQANGKLDEQNNLLESEVAKKTAYLSKIMLDLEQQKDELLGKQRQLRQENENRHYIEGELRRKNQALADSMAKLEQTSVQLVEFERIASLNGLLSSLNKQVSVPMARRLELSQDLTSTIKGFQQQLQQNTIDKAALNQFFAFVLKQNNATHQGLIEAQKLLQQANEVADLQTAYTQRQIDVKDYLCQVFNSLEGELEGSQHQLELQCPDDVVIRCAPGALAQVVNSMVVNSLEHAFEPGQRGRMLLTVTQVGNKLLLTYTDDGKGLSLAQAEKLFDAFTSEQQSHTAKGLGMHIASNLVEQSLGGSITADCPQQGGLRYQITLPASS